MSRNPIPVVEHSAPDPAASPPFLAVSSASPLTMGLAGTQIGGTYLSMIPTAFPRPSAGRQGLALGGWLLLCFSATISAAFIPPGEWYAQLQKPAWNPPAWVFGPAWTFLYLSMAVAAWLVWREGGWRAQRRALSWFGLQWLLNALWTPLFFGLHRPDLAGLEIIALGLALTVTLREFWRVKPAAGALLVPYLAWVSFATLLNLTLWRLNS